MDAVSLFCFIRERAYASELIDPWCDWLQMVRIPTSRVATEMIQFSTGRNPSNVDGVCNTVNILMPVIYTETAVAFVVQES